MKILVNIFNNIRFAIKKLMYGNPKSHQCSIAIKRKLTDGEILLAQDIFQTSINYSTVYIHNTNYLPFQGNSAIAPNGNIYFPQDYYSDDYSKESSAYRHWFIHEMVHIWQYQLGYAVQMCGAIIHIKSWITKTNPYQYALHDSKKLCDFNMEQQGDIIADYYSYYFDKQQGCSLSCSGAKYRNSHHQYEKVLSHFFQDRSHINNLPTYNQTK